MTEMTLEAIPGVEDGEINNFQLRASHQNIGSHPLNIYYFDKTTGCQPASLG